MFWGLFLSCSESLVNKQSKQCCPKFPTNSLKTQGKDRGKRLGEQGMNNTLQEKLIRDLEQKMCKLCYDNQVSARMPLYTQHNKQTH